MAFHDTNGGSTSTTISTMFEPLLSSRSRSVSPPPPPPPLRQQLHHKELLLLSFPLCISYSCIGMIMSLPSTALLYFVNNYIAIPVSLLPLYLSISFLPYSLKPSYAYLSTSLIQYNLSQQIQIIFLLLICGAAFMMTAFIPQNAIFICFILAFIRSITLAWPSFLLDLCLLDEVDNVILSSAPLPPQESASTSASFQPPTYAEIAATFQSQAATYRSMGCVVANVIALVMFAAPHLLSPPPHNENHQKITDIMNHRMFQFILICTGILNFVCAIVLWRNPSSTIERHHYQVTRSPSDNDEKSISQILLSNNVQSEKNDPATTESTIRLLSYDSIEDDLNLTAYRPKISNSGGPLEFDTCVVDTEPLLLQHGNDTIDQSNDIKSFRIRHVPSPAELNHNDPCNMNRSNNHADGNKSIWLVVLLQLLVVLLTLRQSMTQNFITKIGWTCMVSTLTLLFFNFSYVQFTIVNAQSDANEATTAPSTQQHDRQLRVGLYLILRYSIPSVSYLMSSYVYTIYKEMPSILQFLSLLDMCVTTLACYTYSTYLSKFSSGKQLLWLIAITTILSGIASFGNVLLIRLLNPKISTHQQEHDDNYSMTTKIISTIVINAMIGFFNEWKFFPDVVLATAVSTGNHSVFDMSLSTSLSQHDVSLPDQSIPGPTDDDPLRPLESNPTIHLSHDDDKSNDNATHNNSNNSTTQVSTASSSLAVRSVQYGTLLSCIDFGDQIGVLLAGPLIAICHTTRSNSDDHWQHLEVLQIINSIMIILSASLIFILTIRR